ncbi:hypothetical protein ACWKWU_14145 [Chitinophaga lutea]
MRVFCTKKRVFIEAAIELLDTGELTRTLLSRFEFDWESEMLFQVYKLNLRGKDRILGLMALHIIPEERRIEIRLLEAAAENVGKNKRYDGVAGCLIAYACRQSFKFGFGGFVSLIPKTKLIRWYCLVYGFVPMGRHLVLEGNNAIALITKYLENESV